ncbi:MAG: matrixin family metalloprotease [Mycobacteriales bacterium]
MVDHGGVEGYYAPVTPSAVLAETSQSIPGARRRTGPVVITVLVTLLIMSVSAAFWSVGRARAAIAPPLHSVETAADASAGWGPSYVDSEGRAARWNPCAPIHYVLQTRWAPATGRADLAAALAQLSAASGLTFTDDGDTDEVPLRSRSAYQPDRYGERWAPLLLGWVPGAETDLGLGKGVQGVTVAVAISGKDGGAIVTGQVALDADHRLPGGFGPGATEGEVLLHELAHAVGLGHVMDPTQVMFPQTTNSESQYGAGDRAGLQALGRKAGCLSTPTPRPLRTAITQSRT